MSDKNHSFPGILSAQYNTNPYTHIDSLNKRLNIIYDETLKSCLAISYDASRYVLTNTEVFSTKPLAERAEPVMRGKVLAQMEGAEHKLKRKIVLRQLTGDILKKYYEPILTKLCDSLAGNLFKRKSFDFISEFASKYALLTTFNIAGLDYEEVDRVLEKLKLIAKFATGFNLSEETIKMALLASEELEKLISGMINEKRSHPGNDIISFIIKESNTEKIMNDSEIVALVLNILLAASEPVDKVLTNCIYHLYRHREYISQLINGTCSYNNVLQESLRLTPPVHLIPRLTEKETYFAGIKIKKGDLIYVLIPAANRDDRYFEHPEIYDPYRKFKGPLSYGTGIHACIGAQFATTQLNIALKTLIPVLPCYKETSPPVFTGIDTRGTTEYYPERI